MEPLDAALARYGIFARSAIRERTIEPCDQDAQVGTVSVVVTMDLTLHAPDGSSVVFHAIGHGSGDLMNATASAAEDAHRNAVHEVLTGDDGSFLPGGVSDVDRATVS